VSGEPLRSAPGVVSRSPRPRPSRAVRPNRRAPVAPLVGGDRKHPAAVDAPGETLLAWAEGTGWQREGGLAWRVYDSTGRATRGLVRVEKGVLVRGLLLQPQEVLASATRPTEERRTVCRMRPTIRIFRKAPVTPISGCNRAEWLHIVTGPFAKPKVRERSATVPKGPVNHLRPETTLGFGGHRAGCRGGRVRSGEPSTALNLIVDEPVL
jgi:hypothetical protein